MGQEQPSESARPHDAREIIHSINTSEAPAVSAPLEEALREAERKYRDIFDNAAEGIFQTSPEGKTLTANPALARMLGFGSPEELIRERTNIGSQHYVDPKRRQEFKQLLEENDVVRGFEYQGYRKDGSKIWLSDSVRAVRDEAGTLLYYEGTAQDITERKQAEDRLRESEERYRDLVENSRDLICTHDLDGQILSVNRTAAEVLGYDQKDYCGKKNLRDILAAEVRDQLDDYLFTIRNEGVASGLMLVQTAAGERRIWEYHNTLRTEGLATPIVRGMARDITERKRAEESLREAERKYRDIFENAGEGIFQSTPNGKFIAANPALARMHGFDSPEEFIQNRNDIPRQIYADSARREEFKQLIDEHGVVRGFEHQVLKKDGSKIWISVNARAVRDKQGKLWYYEGTAQDITERKHAEDQLRESEERYRQLFENAKDAIYVHDLDGIYTSVNRAAEKLIGYPRAEILGKNFADFFPAPQLQQVRESLCRKLSEKGETCYETEVLAKDGRLVPIEVSSRLIYENGVAVGVQGMARDITERKRAEEALRESEERFSKAFYSNPTALSIALLEDGRLLEVNEAFLRVTGYERQELIGRTTLDVGLWADSDRKITMARVLREQGTVENFEVRFRRKSGEIREGLLSVELIELRGEHGVLGIIQDVTERKLAEEELRTTGEQLRALSASLRSAREEEGARIARELHDELGSVLTTLNWGLDDVDKTLLAGDPRDLAALRRKIATMTTLVNATINTVRRISSELRPSVLDDLGLVEAIEWQARQFQAQTGIAYESDCSLETVNLNREQSTAIFRIFQEALTNILRHADATKFVVTIKAEAGEFVLMISDNGKGITESGMSGAQSLGLLGMRERAKLLNGHINIAGVEGQGTSVTVRVPLINRTLSATSAAK